jgi:TPP-dependent pyruvate/acetoin dehydrogenase alpha subunit
MGEKLTETYRKMLEIRFFEDKVFKLCGQNLVPGTIHRSIVSIVCTVFLCSGISQRM